MADNVQHPITGTGTADVVQKTDDLSGAQVPYVKILDGTNGGTEPVPVDAIKGFKTNPHHDGTPATATWDDTTADETTLAVDTTGYAGVVATLFGDGAGYSQAQIIAEEYDGVTWLAIHGINLDAKRLAVQTVLPVVGQVFNYRLYFPTPAHEQFRLRLAEVIVGDESVSIRLTPTTADSGAIMALLRTVGHHSWPRPEYGVMMGGSDGSNLRQIKTDSDGELQVDIVTLPALGTGGNVIGKIRGGWNHGFPPDADNPVVIGGVASVTGPGAVDDGAAVQAWFTLDGKQVVAATGADGWGNPFTENPVVAAGVDGAFNVQPLKTDADGELQVDVLTLPAITGAVTANAGTNLNTSTLALEAGGNLAAAAASLATLDNIVAGSEAQVDVVAALPAGDNNIGNVDVASLPALVAGSANIGDVDVLTLPALVAGTANIGDVDVLTVPADPFGVNADAASATGSISAKLRFIAATGIPVTSLPAVTGSVTANAGTNLNTSALALEAGGNLAAIAASTAALDDGIKTDDAAFTVATDEVLMQGRLAVAHGADPDALDAGDAGASIQNRHRVPFVIGGHPNIITVKHTNITTAVTDAAIITVGAGNKIVLTAFMCTLDNASTVFPTVLMGFGTANTPTTTGVIAAHGGIPAGGGFARGDGSGILGIGGDGEDLRITTTGNATGNGLQIVITYYLTPS